MTITDLRQLIPIVDGLGEVAETNIARIETLEAEVAGLHSVVEALVANGGLEVPTAKAAEPNIKTPATKKS